MVLPGLSPAMRKELIEFTRLHGVDSAEDIGEIYDRIDVVTLAGDNKREVDSQCSTSWCWN
jgi:hypothetical protein